MLELEVEITKRAPDHNEMVAYFQSCGYVSTVNLTTLINHRVNGDFADVSKFAADIIQGFYDNRRVKAISQTIQY